MIVVVIFASKFVPQLLTHLISTSSMFVTQFITPFQIFGLLLFV
jgi:hypothetical protein